MNTKPPASTAEELLQNAAAATGSMLTELKGFAEVSSFGTSRLTARDALQRLAAKKLAVAFGFGSVISALPDNLESPLRVSSGCREVRLFLASGLGLLRLHGLRGVLGGFLAWA